MSVSDSEIVCYIAGNAITNAKVREPGLHFAESEGTHFRCRVMGLWTWVSFWTLVSTGSVHDPTTRPVICNMGSVYQPYQLS